MKTRLIVLLFSSVLLLVVSVFGITRAVRASAAYILYHQVRYGGAGDNVQIGLANCALASRYYPYNYYFAIWASEHAYYESLKVSGDDSDYMLKAADYWCDRGLYLNRYKSQLRMMRARLLVDESPQEALAYWKTYVDWHYWEPFNHCALAEFYAKAGDFDAAFRALEVIRGMQYYEDGLGRVNEVWHREMAMPDLGR